MRKNIIIISALCGKPAKYDVTFFLTIPMNFIEEYKKFHCNFFFFLFIFKKRK